MEKKSNMIHKRFFCVEAKGEEVSETKGKCCYYKLRRITCYDVENSNLILHIIN